MSRHEKSKKRVRLDVTEPSSHQPEEYTGIDKNKSISFNPEKGIDKTMPVAESTRIGHMPNPNLSNINPVEPIVPVAMSREQSTREERRTKHSTPNKDQSRIPLEFLSRDIDVSTIQNINASKTSNLQSPRENMETSLVRMSLNGSGSEKEKSVSEKSSKTQMQITRSSGPISEIINWFSKCIFAKIFFEVFTMLSKV